MKQDLFDKLGSAILEYDAEAAEELTREILSNTIDPLETLDVLTDALRIVGDKFEKDEIFLPELIAAAEAMTASTTLLEAEIRRQGREKQSLGKIVIGTVFGDIHDIGKNIVATLLKAAGYAVTDAGINVQSPVFVDKVTTENAQVLALSALLTTTAPEQKKVINDLKENGIRDTVKVIVGGGGITQQFADSIEADGYASTAAGGVKLVKQLLHGEEG